MHCTGFVLYTLFTTDFPTNEESLIAPSADDTAVLVTNSDQIQSNKNTTS